MADKCCHCLKHHLTGHICGRKEYPTYIQMLPQRVFFSEATIGHPVFLLLNDSATCKIPSVCTCISSFGSSPHRFLKTRKASGSVKITIP